MKTKEEIKIYKREWARKYRELHRGNYRRGQHPNCHKNGFKKGHKNFNVLGTGLIKRGEHRGINTEFKKFDERLVGEKSIHWKGDMGGYVAKHSWMRRWHGIPKKCEHCKKINCKRYNWANISGKYLRDRNDWFRLCSSCHKIYDLKRIRNKSNRDSTELQFS